MSTTGYSSSGTDLSSIFNIKTTTSDFAITNSGVYNWSSITSDSTGQYLAACVYGGYIYTSDDYGTNWTQQTASGSYNWSSITSNSTGLYLAACYGGVSTTGYLYVSRDRGVTWVKQTDSDVSSAKRWTSISSDDSGSLLVACAYNEYIYIGKFSFGTQLSWDVQTSAGSRDWKCTTSNFDGSLIIVGSQEAYIYTGVPSFFFNSYTWTQRLANGSLNFTSITTSYNGEYSAACNNNNYIYTSNDSGVTWTAQTSSTSQTWASITSDTTGQYLAACDSSNGYIYISQNYGNSWTISNQQQDWYGITCDNSGQRLAACVYGGSIYVNSTSPTNYSVKNYGIVTQTTYSSSYWVGVVSTSSGKVLATIQDTGYIYVSSDYGNSWSQRVSSQSWKDITINSNDGKYMAACYIGGPIYISSNFGVNWSSSSSGTKNWLCITSSGTGQYLAAGVSNDYIYTSNDYGVNWTQSNSIVGKWSCITSDNSGQYLAACIYDDNGAIYTSSDFGSTWSKKYTSPANNYWTSIKSSSDGKRLFASTPRDSVYVGYTTNYTSWTWVRIIDDTIKRYGTNSVTMDSTGQYLFYCGFTNISMSSDYGITWNSIVSNSIEISGLEWYGIASNSTGEKLVAIVNTSSGSVGYIYLINLLLNSDLSIVYEPISSVTNLYNVYPFSKNGYITSDTTGQYLACSAVSDNVYSKDFGKTWTTSSTDTGECISIASDSTGKYVVIANNSKNIFFSSDYGSNYTSIFSSTNNSISMRGVTINSNGTIIVFILTGYADNYIYYQKSVTHNFSTSAWINISNNIQTLSTFILHIAMNSTGDKFIVSTTGLGCYYTTYSGTSPTWSASGGDDTSGSIWRITPITSSYTYMITTGTITRIRYSTNYGVTWGTLSTPSSTLFRQICTDMNGNGQYVAVCDSDNIYVSYDFGTNWTTISTIIDSTYGSLSLLGSNGKYFAVVGQDSSYIYHIYVSGADDTNYNVQDASGNLIDFSKYFQPS